MKVGGLKNVAFDAMLQNLGKSIFGCASAISSISPLLLRVMRPTIDQMNRD